MDRRQAISRMFAALSGAAATIPAFAYAKPSSKDLQGLTLDAKITDLKTGQPIQATIRYLPPADFESKYGLSIKETDTSKPQKVGVEISANGYVAYATAGYLDSAAGYVYLQNPYGDNERVLIPENDLLVKEMCDVIPRKNNNGGVLTKHPDLRNVKYQIKTTNAEETQIVEEVIREVAKLSTNGYVSLPSGVLVKNPGLVKGRIADIPPGNYRVFTGEATDGGLIRSVTGGYASLVLLMYVDKDTRALRAMRQEFLGASGMDGEPGVETGTTELEQKIADTGGSIFNDAKGASNTITERDGQVIKFFSTRAIGNRKIPLNEKFPKLYDFDPGHILTTEQIPVRQIAGDFNTDGRVDFDDFFAFADVFGERKGSSRYNALFDLDGDGMIGFGDFFLFAENFGKKR